MWHEFDLLHLSSLQSVNSYILKIFYLYLKLYAIFFTPVSSADVPFFVLFVPRSNNYQLCKPLIADCGDTSIMSFSYSFNQQLYLFFYSSIHSTSNNIHSSIHLFIQPATIFIFLLIFSFNQQLYSFFYSSFHSTSNYIHSSIHLSIQPATIFILLFIYSFNQQLYSFFYSSIHSTSN